VFPLNTILHKIFTSSKERVIKVNFALFSLYFLGGGDFDRLELLLFSLFGLALRERERERLRLRPALVSFLTGDLLRELCFRTGERERLTLRERERRRMGLRLLRLGGDLL